MAITAARKLTGCRTGIDIGIIAVVTAFMPVFTFGDIDADMTVATTGSLAERGTTIAVLRVAIITGLALMHDAVTTVWQFAHAGAGVAVVGIAVITGFNAGLDKAIATTSRLTSCGAVVVIQGVAIIALLAGLHRTIAAAIDHTAVLGIADMVGVISAEGTTVFIGLTRWLALFDIALTTSGQNAENNNPADKAHV